MITDEEEIESNSGEGEMSRGRGRAVERGRGRCSSSRRPLGRSDTGPRTERRVRTQRVGKNITCEVSHKIRARSVQLF